MLPPFRGGDVPSDNGRWWIEANQLCQRWTSWLNGQTYCYKLTRQGDTVQWSRNDGRSGTVRAESTPLHRGKRTMVWQTRVTDEGGRLLSMTIQTQMVLA